MPLTDKQFIEDGKKLKRFIKRIRHFPELTFVPHFGRIPIYMITLDDAPFGMISYNRLLLFKPPIRISADTTAFQDIDIATSSIELDARQSKLASDYLEMLIENYDPL
jgi:hypothetical protein